MDYRNVAYGHVPQLGFIELRWNPGGGIRVAQAYTRERVELCDSCAQTPVRPDATPGEILGIAAYCGDGVLFGIRIEDIDKAAIWGPESFYRRARNWEDMGISAAGLLAVLHRAAWSPWWRVEAVPFEKGSANWMARLSMADPLTFREFLGPVNVDAGAVRSMLRTAQHLMPEDCPARGVLDALMTDDPTLAAKALRLLSTRDADMILQYAAFGREAF
ncbi:hypothetical protein ACFU99_00810 [Streptomyces sp. NPDC057654]|uniref:hypothetical protein n=1 Tax=Streptomyces sp. NPDC057654 TaxID=3346196 RepID=UPI0036B0B54A